MKYVPLDDRVWTEEEVTHLLQTDRGRLFDCLASIMQYGRDIDAIWKVALGQQLLDKERDQSLRSRVWGALCVFARENNTDGLGNLAEQAWRLLDTENDSQDRSVEAMRADAFLSDLRVFAFDAMTDQALLITEAQSTSRLKVFRSLYALSLYAPLDLIDSHVVACSRSGDFVIRESGIRDRSKITSLTRITSL